MTSLLMQQTVSHRFRHLTNLTVSRCGADPGVASTIMAEAVKRRAFGIKDRCLNSYEKRIQPLVNLV